MENLVIFMIQSFHLKAQLISKPKLDSILRNFHELQGRAVLWKAQLIKIFMKVRDLLEMVELRIVIYSQNWDTTVL